MRYLKPKSSLLGVWASGDTWHYSPMAATLAASGIVTCVMTHTLYPEAYVPEMTLDVSNALDWVFDNISSRGGSPDKVCIVVENLVAKGA